jgi:carboxypeptidase C (cathepsin A)
VKKAIVHDLTPYQEVAVRRVIVGCAWLVLVLASAVLAQRPGAEVSYLFDAPARTASSSGRAEAPKDPYVDRTVDSSHVAKIGGQEIRYTATAGSLPLVDAAGTVKAHMFFVAYTKDGVADPSTRPIMFAYNGGPGSASIWLHMGALGPRRVQMADEGFQPAPPFKLVDNEESLLDVTDIVMIDAMGTGYSRVAAGEDPRQFFGSTPDIQTFGEFIRTYITKYRRWPSPKVLFGESYGTTRSAGLAAELQQRHGIELSGIVLVSAVVDFGSQEYAPGHDLAYATYLPTLAATAWYHKKVAPDLQKDLKQTVDEARTFAMGEYLLALAKGNRLTTAERQAVAKKLARYTGLSESFILSCHLRVTDARFRKELLRDRGLMVGRLDGRFTGLDADFAGERQEFDPSNTALQGAYTAMFSDYVRRELKYENDIKYDTSGNVRPWSYAEFQNRYVNMTEPLRSAMARNPFLKVFVANGYYDMATPFFSTEFTFDHLGFEPTYRDRVSMGFYEAGHMMYIRPSAHREFKRDTAQFIRNCTAGR